MSRSFSRTTARLLPVLFVLIVLGLASSARAERPADSGVPSDGIIRQTLYVDLSDPARTVEVTIENRGTRLAIAQQEEERALRAGADPAGYTLGDGRRVDLRLVKSEVVVKWNTETEVALSRAGGKTLDLIRREDFGDRLGVFELGGTGSATDRTRGVDLGDLLADLNANPDVEYAMPTYYDLASATRLWPTDRVIVGVERPELAGEILANFPELLDAGHLLNDENVRVFRFAEPRGADPLATADRITQVLGANGVQWAEPDFHMEYSRAAVPNDSLFAECWHLHNTGQAIAGALGVDNPTAGVDVNAPAAWDNATGSGVVVAIIDDGVQTNHPDLNLYTNSAEANGSSGVDDDGNGFVDDINGWDFRSNDNNPNPGTYDAHGTACAGVAVGRGNNNLGTVGAAYNASVLPIKIANATASSGGFASSTAIANAINYAWTKADVLSNSWGGGSPSTAIQSAIKNANQYGRNGLGSTVLFANGNSAAGFIKARLGGLPAGTWSIEWRYTKNASGTGGEDSIWMDDIELPGIPVVDFEGSSSLPSGWSTSGNASWSVVSGGTHRRSGSRAVKAGNIGNNQSTSLFFNGALGAGDIGYHIWYSTQLNGDVCDIRLTSGSNNYGPFIALSGESNQYGDPAYRQNDESSPSSWPEGVSVAAVAADGYRSYYSQYGSLTDFGAPSNGHSANAGISTIDRTSTAGYNTSSGSAGDYCRAGEDSGFGGTSSATPLAAGVAALIISANPNLSQSQVRDVMRRTASKIGPVAYAGGAGDWMGGRNNEYGYGMLDADAAVDFANSGSPATGQMAANVMITEVHPAPSGGGVEFVEIYNKSTSTTYSLTGFGITDNEMFDDTGEGLIQFPTGASIPPRGMVLVVTNGAANSAFVSAATSNAGGAGAPAGGVQVFEATNSGLSFGGSQIPNMTSVGGTPSLTDSGDNIALVFTGGDEVSYRGDVVSGMSYGSVSISSNNQVAVQPGVLEASAESAPSSGQSLHRNDLTPSNSSAADFASGSSDPGAWSALGGGPSAPATPASITYPSTDSDGSYTVSWAASTGATSYTLQRSSNGGSSYSTVYTGSSTSYGESVGEGTYVYRVSASNSAGTSSYRTGGSVVVDFPASAPATPASISYASSSSTGSYTVSWASSSGATSYTLQRSSNGGSSYSTVYTGSSTSYGESIGNGSYRYRVSATNSGGTSGYRTGTSDIVVNIPVVTDNDTFATPELISGANGTTTDSNAGASKESGEPNHGGNSGGRSVWFSWTPTGSGSVTIDTVGSNYDTTLGVYTGSAVNSLTTIASNDDIQSGNLRSSVTFTANAGTNYRIAVDGYGGASGNITLNWDQTVSVPAPGTPSSISYPSSDSDGSYTVSWSSSSGATSYTLQRSSNGGSSYSTIYTGSSTSYGETIGNGSYRYRVSASNSSGTSSYRTGTGDCVVSIPVPAPGTPSSISYPASDSDGSYTVSWSSSSGATSYTLQRSSNGGSSYSTIYTGSSTSYGETIGNGSYRYRVSASNSSGTSSYRTGSGDCVVNIPVSTDNNDFADAFTLSGASGSTTGTNSSANKQSGEPNHGGNSGGRSVWWKWTAPGSGSTTINTFGSSYDTTLGVYTGSSVSSLSTIGSNDDSGGTYQSQVTFTASSGTTYYIAVDGYNGASGNIDLSWSLTVASAPGTPASISHPSSDSDGNYTVSWSSSSGATSYTLQRSSNGGSSYSTVYTGSSTSYGESVGEGSFRYRVSASNASGTSGYRTSTSDTVVDFPSQGSFNNTFASAGTLIGTSGTITGSNSGASKQSGEPNHGGNSGGRSVWVKWVAPSSGTLTVNTYGSSYDTTLGAYTGSSVSSLTTRASNDDASGLQSQVSFSVSAGTTYYIAVDGYNGASGNITLNWSM